MRKSPASPPRTSVPPPSPGATPASAWKWRRKTSVASDAPAAVAASRACYNLNDGGRAIQGKGDLVTDLAEGKVKLKEIKKDELPDELKKLNDQERKEFIEKQQTKRTELNSQLGKLVQQRDSFMRTEQERLAKEGKGDSFDLKCADIISEQIK